jgi:hypothetical protein
LELPTSDGDGGFGGAKPSGSEREQRSRTTGGLNTTHLELFAVGHRNEITTAGQEVDVGDHLDGREGPSSEPDEFRGWQPHLQVFHPARPA